MQFCSNSITEAPNRYPTSLNRQSGQLSLYTKKCGALSNTRKIIDSRYDARKNLAVQTSSFEVNYSGHTSAFRLSRHSRSERCDGGRIPIAPLTPFVSYRFVLNNQKNFAQEKERAAIWLLRTMAVQHSLYRWEIKKLQKGMRPNCCNLWKKLKPRFFCNFLRARNNHDSNLEHIIKFYRKGFGFQYVHEIVSSCLWVYFYLCACT